MVRAFPVLFLLLAVKAQAIDIDSKLDLVASVNNLNRERVCREELQPFYRSLIDVGEKIFESKSLSGEKDTSCSTCHLKALAFSDGLQLAVGVGGSGESEERLLNASGVVVPRNAFSLVGRGDINFRTYFWDGKVHAQRGGVFSPVGEMAESGFSSPLAVAAILPLLARDEFLGTMGLFNQSPNLNAINGAYHEERYKAASKFYRNQILSSTTGDLQKIAELFRISGTDLEELELSDIGNALASFISEKISCKSSPWQDYLEGNKQAISQKAKRGALIFYGKGRCGGCHSGSLFSDQKFYSIASPQGSFGPALMGRDLGRSEVSLDPGDRFLFRTPPLLSIDSTAPYGHNGIFPTLESVVLHHMNPLEIFIKRGWSNEEERFTFGQILQKRAPTLGYIDIRSEEDFGALIEFIKQL